MAISEANRGSSGGASPGQTSLSPASLRLPTSPSEARPLGLYLHIPFCAAICSYCNFNRGLLDEPQKRAYVDALEREIRGAGDRSAVDTLYFGGGTPSLLDPAEVGRLIAACRESFEVAPDAEVTLELNPESATAERLDGFRRAGVSRLSIGVQSLHDEALRRLGRLHSAARAVEAVHLSRVAGFDNLSLDLMLWLPEQTVSGWLDTVERAVALDPDHVSLYLLEVYPNAPLREDMARAGWSQAPDEDAAEMYLGGLARLEASGFRQYEISNVARPGRESRHNLKYWSDGEWLAFGCGAHGTRNGQRWRNVSSTAEYVARIRAGQDVVVERRVLAPRERLEDALFMGIRLYKGLALADIAARYGVDVWDEYGVRLEPFVRAGLLEYTPPVLRLTRKGMLLANEVCAVFV